MDSSNPCFNPKTFLPSNTPLLSLSQWQMLQLYLVDAQNLRLTSAQMPYPNVLEIYIKLNAQAINFHGTVLPKAHSLGNNLFNYGQTASRSFGAIAQLMSETNPNKTAILELMNNLKETAVQYQSDSESIFSGISSYISETSDDVSELNEAVKQEVAKAGADQTKITNLQLQYDSSYTDMQIAQTKITSDNKAINSTKYYSWVPFVGTVIAVGEIIAKEHDISKQIARIHSDVASMQSTSQQMQLLHKDIGQLTYASKYNTHMATEINNAMGGLTLIKGAWGTITTELGDVIENIEKATSSELKNNQCLASVYLTTAANEWDQVADDAQTFADNFYLEPATPTLALT